MGVATKQHFSCPTMPTMRNQKPKRKQSQSDEGVKAPKLRTLAGAEQKAPIPVCRTGECKGKGKQWKALFNAWQCGNQLLPEEKAVLAAIYVIVCNMQQRLLQDAKAEALEAIRTECNKSGLCTLLRAGGEKVAVAFDGYVYLFRFSGARSLTEEVHYSQSFSVDVPVQFAHPTKPKILVQCSRSTKMEAGDLFDLMEGRLAMSKEELDVVVIQLLELLVWLHCQQIVHNDLNPANIFVTWMNQSFKLIVGDFSMATRYITGEPSDVRVGTKEWKLDERFESVYDPMLAQTFSFALVIWWVITGSPELPGPYVLRMGSTWCQECPDFKAAEFKAYAKNHSEFCASLQEALSPTPLSRPHPRRLLATFLETFRRLYGDSIELMDFTQSRHYFGQ